MLEVLKNLNWPLLTDALLSVIPALICITIHELAHGYTAYRLGDDTAKQMGRLTLNPIKHIDFFGFLMMIVFKFGWANPVPVNPHNFKKPKRDMAITALAGPLSNILLAVFLLLLYGGLFPILKNKAAGTVLEMIYITAYLSISLAAFNIIPIPPLDGAKVLFSFVSDRTYFKLMRYERYGMIILIAVTALNILPISAVTDFLFRKLFIVAEMVYHIVSKIVH